MGSRAKRSDACSGATGGPRCVRSGRGREDGGAGAGRGGSAHGAASAAVHPGLGAWVGFAPRPRLAVEDGRILNLGAASTGALLRPRQASKRLMRSGARRSGLKTVQGGGWGAGAKTGGRPFQPAAPPTATRTRKRARDLRRGDRRPDGAPRTHRAHRSAPPRTPPPRARPRRRSPRTAAARAAARRRTVRAASAGARSTRRGRARRR